MSDTRADGRPYCPVNETSRERGAAMRLTRWLIQRCCLCGDLATESQAGEHFCALHQGIGESE